MAIEKKKADTSAEAARIKVRLMSFAKNGKSWIT